MFDLIDLPGREITGAIVDSIDTVSKLHNVAQGAELDEALLVHTTSAAGWQALVGHFALRILRLQSAMLYQIQETGRLPESGKTILNMADDDVYHFLRAQHAVNLHN